MLTPWQNLDIRIDTIVNDSSSSLLAAAYHNKATRIAVILGTGTNASIHLPTSSLAASKFGPRPKAWHDKATHVLVNTEISMFGAHIFPTTPWDDMLNAEHPNPAFQPLEHLVGGRYLGELVRLVLLDGIRHTGLFDGQLPHNFDAYELSTETISAVERDESALLTHASALLNTRHPLPDGREYRHKDVLTIRRVAHLVSSRAAAYLAAAIHALWMLQQEADGREPLASDEGDTDVAADASSIGCAGSVLERYPLFRERTQSWVSRLVLADGCYPRARVHLEVAAESALIGAAVAAATAG